MKRRSSTIGFFAILLTYLGIHCVLWLKDRPDHVTTHDLQLEQGISRMAVVCLLVGFIGSVTFLVSRFRNNAGVSQEQISPALKVLAIGAVLLSLSGFALGFSVPRANPMPSSRDNCRNNLRLINGAIRQYADKEHLPTNAVVTTEQLLPFLPGMRLPKCPVGGIYTFGPVENAPKCSVPGHSLPY